MTSRTLLFLLLPAILFAFKGDKPAYLVFDKDGKAADYSAMLKAAKGADVVFFGELHNNPIAHWLQLELTRDLHAKKKEQLVLGAEMFEADNQLMINEYLSGAISARSFEQECRLWPNYDTDYKPLMEFAKENGLQFVAANIPRRYAAVVYRNGFEALNELDDDAKRYIAPLPPPYDPEVKCYKDMLEMAGGHGGDNLPKAQAIKDATMAHFISQNRKEGETLIHYNGAYHSDNYEGIIWYLNQYQPGLNIVTISTVEQADVSKLDGDSKGKADFVIAIPETMTKTH